MNVKGQKYVIILGLAMIGTIIAYTFFAKSSYFEVFKVWAQSNIILYYISLIGIKIIGLVWPPIPGGILTLGSIPVIGWMGAYLSDLAGSVIGSTIAYWLAYKWGRPLLLKIFGEDMVSHVDRFKISKKHEFEGIFLLRIFGGSVVEVVCYGAGLIRITFWKFLAASIASHIVIGLPTFFFFGGIFSGRNYLINLAVIAIPLFLLYKYRHTYFEYQK